MNGRRIYHARGKVLGGSSSINGMIFQRGNPLDYERWAADPGMETWDYLHCLPYFKRMETLLSTAGADAWRGGSGPLVLERGPADQPAVRRVLRGRPAGRLPADRRRQRLPAGGLRALRPQRAPRPPALRRPRLPAPGDGPAEPHASRPSRWPPGSLFDGKRAAGVDYLRGGRAHALGQGRRGHPVRRRDQHPAAAAALRASATPSTSQPLGVDMVHDLPGVGENLQDHLEVYIQYASKQPVSIAPGLRWRNRPRIGYRLAVPPHAASAPPTTSRAAASPQQRRRRLPQPDVPLPAGRDPLRRHRRPPRATATRCTSARCTPTPAAGCRIAVDRPEAAPGDAVQLPLDAHRPPGVGRGGPGRPRHPQPARLRAVQRRRALARARRSRPTRRSSTGSREDAETALHPSCTAKMGVDEMSVIDPTSMRVHGVEGLRVVDASASSPTSPTATSTPR